MFDIIKNLASSEISTVLITLGILKELRLLIKIILDYKLESKKLSYKKVRGK